MCEGNDVEWDVVMKMVMVVCDGGDGGVMECVSGEDDVSVSVSVVLDDFGLVEWKLFSAWRWVATRTLLFGLVARCAFVVLVWLVIVMLV